MPDTGNKASLPLRGITCQCDKPDLDDERSYCFDCGLPTMRAPTAVADRLAELSGELDAARDTIAMQQARLDQREAYLVEVLDERDRLRAALDEVGSVGNVCVAAYTGRRCSECHCERASS